MYASDGEAAAAEAAAAASHSTSGGRRPMNAFLLFCNRHRAIVKEKYPNLENRSVTKILGEWWQSLDDDDKSNFNHLASEYKEFVMRDHHAHPPGGGGGGTGPRWRKQSPSGLAAVSSHHRPPSPPSLHHDQDASRLSTSSHGSSSSSSPEPGPCSSSNNSTAAPKPFKKRYLAAEKAKMSSSGEDGTGAGSVPGSGQHSGSVSPDAEHACEALLQLAGCGRATSPVGGTEPTAANNSKTPGEGFRTLRDAVWSRVAHTLLKQEEEKGSGGGPGGHASDVPLNLSSQCTIRGQTIIEHIIENILDKPLAEGGCGGEPVAMNLNNNRDVAAASQNGGDAVAETAEQIKQRIYQSLKRDGIKTDTSSLWKMLPHDCVKKDKSDPKKDSVESSEEDRSKEEDESAGSPKAAVKNEDGEPVPAVSVTLVPATSAAKKAASSASSQSHSVTITPAAALVPSLKRAANDDDDEDIRRSARSCKGRRYQEFKDEGRLGRNSHGAKALKRTHPDAPSSDSSVSILPLNGDDNTQFDVAARLSAIPALSLEAYQQKMLSKAPGSGPGPGTSTRASRGSSGSPTVRRRSCELQQREDGLHHVAKARGGKGGRRSGGMAGPTAAGAGPAAAEINVSS